jgi:hypothetical protein
MIQTFYHVLSGNLMKRFLVIAILMVVNAIPVTLFGSAVLDAIHPQVSVSQNVSTNIPAYNGLDDIIRLLDQAARPVNKNLGESEKDAELRRQAEIMRLKAELEERRKEREKREAAEEAAAEKVAEQERAVEMRDQRRKDIKFAVGVVVVIFVITLVVLGVLSLIGGPLQAEVKAVVNKFGGKLWITAAGLVGAFLAIAILGVASVYLVATIHL